ncbi:hypothetical protein [Thermopirellula anaerolimosa]
MLLTTHSSSHTWNVVALGFLVLLLAATVAGCSSETSRKLRATEILLRDVAAQIEQGSMGTDPYFYECELPGLKKALALFEPGQQHLLREPVILSAAIMPRPGKASRSAGDEHGREDTSLILVLTISWLDIDNNVLGIWLRSGEGTSVEVFPEFTPMDFGTTFRSPVRPGAEPIPWDQREWIDISVKTAWKGDSWLLLPAVAQNSDTLNRGEKIDYKAVYIDQAILTGSLECGLVLRSGTKTKPVRVYFHPAVREKLCSPGRGK